MNAQQLIALLIVATAGAYLAKCLVASARAFFSSRDSGCGGCGKCSFAPKNAAVRPAAAKERPGIIPLGDIRTLPKK